MSPFFQLPPFTTGDDAAREYTVKASFAWRNYRHTEIIAVNASAFSPFRIMELALMKFWNQKTVSSPYREPEKIKVLTLNNSDQTSPNSSLDIFLSSWGRNYLPDWQDLKDYVIGLEIINIK